MVSTRSARKSVLAGQGGGAGQVLAGAVGQGGADQGEGEVEPFQPQRLREARCDGESSTRPISSQ